MAGRHYTPSSTFKPRSPALLLLLSFLALTLVFYIFSIFSSSSPTHTYSLSNPNIDYSFVTSLEKFLTKSPRSQSNGDDSVSETNSVAYAKKLDNSISKIENQRLYNEPFYAFSPLKVYVYEMPSKFTYDLLWLFHNTYKETSNLTSNGSPVHRLIEQHSIDYWLWADLIAPESERLLKNVIRVHKQEEADLFYIPFFTTISFFLLEKPQCKALYRDALKWVMDQPAWNRSGGRDHILPVHHPWSFKTVRKFMKKAIWLLPDMDSTGNWYKPGQVYLEKDLILPYVPNVDLCDAKCLSASKRTTLLFFRGRLKRNAGGKIRAKLVEDLRSSEGVLIEEGTAGQGGKAAAQSGMRKSIFCLNPAGDTPSSARLFDAIVSGCIPVIVSDELELPFEGILDYRKIALFVSSSDALQPGWLVSFLKSVGAAQIKEMQMNLAKYARHFLYSHPAQPLGPEDLVWRMVRHLLDFSWLSFFSYFLGAFIWFFQDTLVPKKGCSRSKVLLFWLDIAVLITLFYVLVSISFTPFMSIAGCLLNIAFMSFDKGGISRKARECFMSYSCSYRLFCSGLASMQGKFCEQNPCTSTVITVCCDITMMI